MSKKDERMKILVVDDYEESAFVTSRLLEGLGYEVDTAYDGPSAIEKADAQKPDVVLMDISMPGMDGYEACEEMRKIPALEDTVIIALTGWEDSEVKTRSRQAGFNDVVLKSGDVTEVQKKIKILKH